MYNDSLHQPNPEDTRSIVHRPMGQQITASCDTAWIRTRGSVVTPLALRCSALDRCTTREPQMPAKPQSVLYAGALNALSQHIHLPLSIPLSFCHAPMLGEQGSTGGGRRSGTGVFSAVVTALDRLTLGESSATGGNMWRKPGGWNRENRRGIPRA